MFSIISKPEMISKCVGDVQRFICKHYTILYKELEHLQVLLSSGVLKLTLCGYWGTTVWQTVSRCHIVCGWGDIVPECWLRGQAWDPILSYHVFTQSHESTPLGGWWEHCCVLRSRFKPTPVPRHLRHMIVGNWSQPVMRSSSRRALLWQHHNEGQGAELPKMLG